MRNLLFILLAMLLVSGCHKSNQVPPVNASPSQAILTFPLQNAVCVSGVTVSDSLSTVIFTWNPSDNTDNYDLYLKNLLTGTVKVQNTIHPQLALTILRNTPFSWYIVSKSTKFPGTAQSDTWKFYNAGLGTVTYAPFPAQITAPTYGKSVAAGTINLTWTGSSVNPNTIINYDVYFGTTNSPPIFKSAIADSFVNSVNVTSKSTYYWRVVTHDFSGNTSDSGLYQFSVN